MLVLLSSTSYREKVKRQQPKCTKVNFNYWKIEVIFDVFQISVFFLKKGKLLLMFTEEKILWCINKSGKFFLAQTYKTWSMKFPLFWCFSLISDLWVCCLHEVGILKCLAQYSWARDFGNKCLKNIWTKCHRQ